MSHHIPRLSCRVALLLLGSTILASASTATRAEDESPRPGPGLPGRLGPWRLHVLEEPRKVELESDGTSRIFEVPVYVYLPDPAARRPGSAESEAEALLERLAGSGWSPAIAEEVEAWRSRHRARPVGGPVPAPQVALSTPAEAP